LQLRNGAAHDVDAWTAHPGHVDVATALGVLLGRWDDPDVLYIPAGYDSVTAYTPLPAEVAVHAVRAAASNDEMLVVDFVITDASGHVLLAVDGLALRPLHDAGSFALGDLDDDADASGRAVAPLLALAEELGIREDEGPELLERLVASGATRLVAPSVDSRAELRMPDVGDVTAAEGAGRGTTGGTVEDVIAAMWRELLGLPDVTHDDDFFDMGGHSLIAIRLMARIHRELGVRFQLATLFEAPTIGALAVLVRAERPDVDATLAAASTAATATSTETISVAASTTVGHGATENVVAAAPAAEDIGDCLIPVRRSGDKEPFFVVHGAGGNVIFLSTLGRALPDDRPVYGFQAKGVNKDETMDASIEAMAARYVAALRAFKPGPYLLGGYSGGGMVALEMAHQLKELGEDVSLVVLFDSIPQDNIWPDRWTRRLNLARNIARHGVKDIRPFLAKRVHWRKNGGSIDMFRDDRLAGLGFVDVEDFGFVDLFHDFTARAERYKMRDHYDVDALLIKAADVWPMHPYDYHLTPYVDHLDVRGDTPRASCDVTPVRAGHRRRRRSCARGTRATTGVARSTARSRRWHRPPAWPSRVDVTGTGREGQRAAGRSRGGAGAGCGGLRRWRVRGHADDGRPLWPAGAAPAASPTPTTAVAAVAVDDDIAAISIDVERAAALDPADAALVLDEREQAMVAASAQPAWTATLLWSVKEAFSVGAVTDGGLGTVDPVDIT
jgi:aryl carrier-like protein